MGLLKGIDPLLTADLLHILRSMGHGDKLVVCDCNFPAAEVATKTTTGKCVQLTVPIPEAISAICSVMPLDYFVNSPVIHMAPSLGLSLPPAGEEVLAQMTTAVLHGASDIEIGSVDREAFYEEARKCFAVVQTMERRPYGNIILQKGVLGPDGTDLKPQGI